MTALETSPSRSNAVSANRDRRLRLALPKGRMEPSIDGVLSEAGIRISSDRRGYRPAVEGYTCFETKRLKPQAVMSMIASGTRDVGFAGADWAMELDLESSLVEVFDTGLDPIRIVAAAPIGVVVDGDGTAPIRIASEMPRIAASWATERGLDYTLVRSWGSTEVLPPEDADVIVDLVQTGATLAANDLRVIDEIACSSTRMYASIQAYECPMRRTLIERFRDLVQSVIEARSRYLVDLNVAPERLEEVLAVIPSMRRPTVSPLAAGGFAVRAAVPRDGFPNLVDRIRSSGGSDLVVSEVRQVIP